jgi:putative ABC transport system permease protein
MLSGTGSCVPEADKGRRHDVVYCRGNGRASGTTIAVTGAMINAVDDLRVTLRSWRRRPLLPATIVATLTGGFAIAASVFAVSWSVLWRPLDLPQADRLLWIAAQSRERAGQSSPGAFAAWEKNARTLDAVVAIRPVSASVTDNGGTDRLRGALVSEAAFAVLGIEPATGRPFTRDDHQAGSPIAVAISDKTWRTRYGGDAAVIGRPIVFNGIPATIVGVLPRGAELLTPDADWWAPLALDAGDRANVGPRYLDVIGRIASGGSVMAARDELDAIGQSLGLRDDDGARLGVIVTPLQQHLTASYATALQLLFGGVLVLVIIATINAAGLMVTRAHERAGEFSLRASLGAGRGRLMRQLLVENGALVAAATAAAVIAALWLTDVLRLLLPPDMPRAADASVDAATMLFLMCVGLCVTAVMSLLPARYASRVDLQTMLRAMGAGAITMRARRIFVVAQVTLAVILGGGAMLLISTARALEAAPRGYDAQGVVTTSINLPSQQYRDPAAIADAINRVIDAAAAIPGVQLATASSQVPFAGGRPGADVVLAEQSFASGVDNQVRLRIVAPGYLQTLGVRVREGRDISRRDAAGSQPIVVVNQALARRLVPDGSPLGRAIKFNIPAFNGQDGNKVWTIVGVADDTWDRGPRQQAEPEVMLAAAQTPAEVFFWIGRELQLAVRSGGDAAMLASSVRRAVASIDPLIGVGPATTLDERIRVAFARERQIAQLLSAVGVAGVALAVLGLGALIHHHVQQRRREIAIRVALGASGARIVRPLLVNGLQLAITGAILGIAAQLILAPMIQSLLFGVAPRDARILAAVAACMVGVSAVAVWIPARRAASINPIEALRD